MNKTCIWEQNEEGAWSTDCGGMFELIDGLPSENKMKFCCYCGKPLVEVPFHCHEKDWDDV